jgi:hypothetical protein
MIYSKATRSEGGGNALLRGILAYVPTFVKFLPQKCHSNVLKK